MSKEEYNASGYEAGDVHLRNSDFEVQEQPSAEERLGEIVRDVREKQAKIVAMKQKGIDNPDHRAKADELHAELEAVVKQVEDRLRSHS